MREKNFRKSKITQKLDFNIAKVKMEENELKGERERCLQAYSGFL